MSGRMTAGLGNAIPCEELYVALDQHGFPSDKEMGCSGIMKSPENNRIDGTFCISKKVKLKQFNRQTKSVETKEFSKDSVYEFVVYHNVETTVLELIDASPNIVDKFNDFIKSLELSVPIEFAVITLDPINTLNKINELENGSELKVESCKLQMFSTVDGVSGIYTPKFEPNAPFLNFMMNNEQKIESFRASFKINKSKVAIGMNAKGMISYKCKDHVEMETNNIVKYLFGITNKRQNTNS